MTYTTTSESKKIPYAWLKSVPAEILANDEIPLFGAPPPFPWEELNSFLKGKLHIEDLEVSRSKISQKTSEELLSGVGTPYRIHCVTVAPLDEDLYIVFSEQEIIKLLSSLLSQEETSLELNKDFIDPFFLFLGMEAIYALRKINFNPQLNFSLKEAPAEVPNTNAHCFDLTITLHQKPIFGRVIIPPSFRKAWKGFFQSNGLQLSTQSPLAEKVEAIIHLEAGRVQMNINTWKTIQVGDFIQLDSCSLEKSGTKGRIILTANGRPLFRGKVKDGNIKILENPLYHEDLTPMPNKKIDQNEDDENIEYFDEDSEFNEEETELSELNEDFEEEIEEDELDYENEEGSLSERHSKSHYSSQHSSNGTENEENESLSPESEEESPLSQEEKQHIKKPQPTKPISPQEVPLDIVVEIGRIRMSLQKLLELEPGNILELDIHPEDGVDLVVNGQKIARAELLSLGETLGVRIIDIG